MWVLDKSSLRQRRHLLPFFAALTLAIYPAISPNAAEAGSSVIGKWTLTSVLDATDITAMTSEKAHDLVGKVMTIDKTKVKLGDYTCLPPDFETERVEPNFYLRKQGYASAANLRLPTPVTVVDVGCSIVFIKTRDRAVISWDGFFFEAVRLRAPSKTSRHTANR